MHITDAQWERFCSLIKAAPRGTWEHCHEEWWRVNNCPGLGRVDFHQERGGEYRHISVQFAGGATVIEGRDPGALLQEAIIGPLEEEEAQKKAAEEEAAQRRARENEEKFLALLG